MEKNWTRDEQWTTQVRRFQGVVRKWNREVFGDIFERKSGLMRRLEEVDNQIASNNSLELDKLRSKIWGEYEKVLQQEELLWFQKSRSKWLILR